MPNGNQAVNINPPNSAIDITTHGSDWLWAVFALMLLSDLAMIGWGFARPRGGRFFHWIAVAALTIMTITYYSMASDLGATPVVPEFFGNHHQDYAGMGVARAIWYVRYIGWITATPLLLVAVLLTTGLTVSDIFGAVFFNIVAVVCGLIGALTTSSYKWGYFAFGTAALIFIWVILLGHSRLAAGGLGSDLRSIHTRHGAYLAFISLFYPICWGLSEGGNVITSDSEMVFYGILDLFIFPIFFFLFHFQLRSVDQSRFGFAPLAPTNNYAFNEKTATVPAVAPAAVPAATAV